MSLRDVFLPSWHATALGEAIGVFTRHRLLIWEMTKREFTDRHAGQVLGALWTVGHPFVLMSVYLVAFLVIFPGRMGSRGAYAGDSAVFILSGLTAWLACQETLAKSAQVLVTNSSLIRQVMFPIEVLPVRVALAALITQSVAMVLLLGYVLVRHGTLSWTYALLPVLLAVQALALIGLGFFLSAVGAYFRDLKELVQIFSVVGIFVAPIFYSPALELPWPIRAVFFANPVSYLVWCYQDVWFYGRLQHWYAWVVLPFGSLLFLVFGHRLFQRVKPMLGNVL